VPIIVAIVVGVGSSYLASTVAIATIEVRMDEFDEEVDELRKTMTMLIDIRAELAAQQAKFTGLANDMDEMKARQVRMWERIRDLEAADG